MWSVRSLATLPMSTRPQMILTYIYNSIIICNVGRPEYVQKKKEIIKKIVKEKRTTPPHPQSRPDHQHGLVPPPLPPPAPPPDPRLNSASVWVKQKTRYTRP